MTIEMMPDWEIRQTEVIFNAIEQLNFTGTVKIEK